MNSKGSFHFKPNYGVFFGELNDNIPHKHYAMQLSVCQSSTMSLEIANQTEQRDSFFLMSNLRHRLESPQSQLTILINPISREGYSLRFLHQNQLDHQLNEDIKHKLVEIITVYKSGNEDFDTCCKRVDLLFTGFAHFFEKEFQLEDDRIATAIQYLDENFIRQVSLEEIAGVCYLSPSRFLHVFKEETQITFRRYKLWNRLVKSLPWLNKQSITTTAHQFGFTDSSHYNRTFKETFGVNPKLLLDQE